MEYVIGFFIATFIALTGVGAGTVYGACACLVFSVFPRRFAVGIGLMFATAVKLILVPCADRPRKNVSWRNARLYASRRRSGRPAGLVLFLQHLVNVHSTNSLNAILGRHPGDHRQLARIIYSFRPMRQHAPPESQARCSPGSCFPSGAEVGFFRRLAPARWVSAALLSLTKTLAARTGCRYWTLPSDSVISLIGSGAPLVLRNASNPVAGSCI